MSGIFGIFYRTEAQNHLAQDIKRMLLWNRPYGRAGEELYLQKNAALGCCLETFPDHTAKDSPMPAQATTRAPSIILKSQNQTAVIDALLYNQQEIARKCGLPLDTSDEELLFTYISLCGIESLKDVNGDFSGAVYNELDRALTLFRDHMGIRPLFYYSDNRLTAFSTDIHGLLALDAADASINEAWIYRTFAGSFLDGLEATEYRHIFCVKPASYITFSLEGDEIKKESGTYWKLGGKKIRFSSFGQYRDKMKDLVTDAVKKRLDAVPGLVGAELSGGLDSGVIDILIHRLGRECLYHSWSWDPNVLPLAEQDERSIIMDICRQENICCHYSGTESGHGTDCNMARTLRQLGIPLQEEYLPAMRYALPPYVNTLQLSETAEYMKKTGFPQSLQAMEETRESATAVILTNCFTTMNTCISSGSFGLPHKAKNTDLCASPKSYKNHMLFLVIRLIDSPNTDCIWIYFFHLRPLHIKSIRISVQQFSTLIRGSYLCKGLYIDQLFSKQLCQQAQRNHRQHPCAYHYIRPLLQQQLQGIETVHCRLEQNSLFFAVHLRQIKYRLIS